MPRDRDPGSPDLTSRRRRRSLSRLRDNHALSPGVFFIASLLSILHLLNFLNYTSLSPYVNPPAARSGLLVAGALGLLVSSIGNLSFHLRRSWDIYALCALAFASAIYSRDPARTLTYSAWLLLSVYVGTELAARVRRPADLAATLAIVVVPATALAAAVNVALGPVVESTGRQFGALGSAHVDTALAMDFVCFFFAMLAFPTGRIPLPQWFKWGTWILLAWALYQCIFGLTRSVWLGVALTIFLYLFRQALSLRTLVIAVAGATAVAVAVAIIGLDEILPDSVQGRLEVTQQRYEAGEVDPRINAIRRAWDAALERPQGTGYAVANAHNSYMNLLLNLGWVGMFFALLSMGRSVAFVARMGLSWTLFFALGSAALLLHAFFEVQTWPGQANFIPLLLWYALSRGRLNGPPKSRQMARVRFVGD